MTSIIRSLDRRSGITYVYESESYWDKAKKAPRSRRRLIGKVDPETGEVVPTSGTRRRAMERAAAERAAREAEPADAGRAPVRQAGTPTRADADERLGAVGRRLEAIEAQVRALRRDIERAIGESSR